MKTTLKEWKVKFPSLTGDKERKAYICLPADYGKSGKRYPVMYMFDGHNLFSDKEATFGKCWGLKDYLDRTKVPVIIAAVECNHEGSGRLSEYSPLNFIYKNEKIKGRGRKYLDWLTKEFKPYIDNNFLTLPDRKNTAIAGSSMGGLMTVYALAKYNKYFSRGAALSPSFWVYGEEVPQFITGGSFKKDTLLYMDYGSREFKNHNEKREIYAKASAALIEKEVLLTSRIVPDGTHSEASWERQIPYFMQILGFMPKE